MSRIEARNELVELVRRIQDFDGDQDQYDSALNSLKESVPHPRVLELLRAWPELSAEEIVERALAYKPIALGHEETK
jgi:hypothetical protein